MKSATEVLLDHSIDIMSMDDNFNSQLLHAMERYAEQFVSQPSNTISPEDVLSKHLAADTLKEYASQPLILKKEKCSHKHTDEYSRLCTFCNSKEEGWVSVDDTDKLPVYIKDGKKYPKKSFVTDGKKVCKAYYYPKGFKQCEWDDLDDADIEEYCDEIMGGYYLKEGWWETYEHRGEYYENRIFNVTHSMIIPSLPLSPIGIIDSVAKDTTNISQQGEQC